MKILVIGGSGVIGYNIINLLKKRKKDVHFTYFKNSVPTEHGYHLDATNKESTLELIKKLRPDIIVHASALTNVDLCETDKKMADALNVSGVENIIKAAKTCKSKLVYISTSAVFDGTKPQYFEDDQTSPVSYYGITKAKGEQIVKDSNLPHLIVRTDQPYCWIKKWQHTNSVLRVLLTLKSGHTLREITDWHNTPTFVPNFADALLKLLENGSEGTFHLVGSDFVTRHELSLRVADIFSLNRKLIEPVSSKLLQLAATRVNVRLDNRKITKETGIAMLGIDEGLRKMLASSGDGDSHKV